MGAGGRPGSPLRESQALLVEIDASLTAEAAGEAAGGGLPGGAASPEAVLRDTEALLRKGRAAAWAAAWAAQASHGERGLPDPGNSPAGRGVLEGVLRDVDQHMAASGGAREWRSDPGGATAARAFIEEVTGVADGEMETGEERADPVGSGGRAWASAGAGYGEERGSWERL